MQYTMLLFAATLFYSIPQGVQGQLDPAVEAKLALLVRPPVPRTEEPAEVVDTTSPESSLIQDSIDGLLLKYGEYDTNGNTVLDKKEFERFYNDVEVIFFKALVQDPTPAEISAMLKSQDPSVLMTHFNDADINHDGVIDASELDNAFSFIENEAENNDPGVSELDEQDEEESKPANVTKATYA